MIKEVKIITAGADGEVFVHSGCSMKRGKYYELHSEPSNSNQPEVFCYNCHGFLGFDHAIQPTKDFP